MTDQVDEKKAKVDELLESATSRKHFLTGAAVAAATVGLAPSVTAAAGLKGLEHAGEKLGMGVVNSLNIAATAEAAAVTALYHVHLAVGNRTLNVSGAKVPATTLVSIVRAALREEQDHYAFLVGAGARPLYTSFSFPNSIFTNGVATLEFFLAAETIFIAAYMAAVRQFGNGRHGALAQYAYQIGAVEAEHRTLMRAGLGLLPPNNKSFETPLFNNVAGAATELARLGIFRPGLTYPGAMAVDNLLATTVTRDRTAGVVQRKP